MPIVLASALNEFVNAWLVIGAVSLQTGRRAFPLWVQNMSWAVPLNILGMSIGGGVLAWGQQIAGPAGTAVFFLPLVFTIYAYRLYVRQTKAQMARLEAIVAQRVQACQRQDRNPERA